MPSGQTPAGSSPAARSRLAVTVHVPPGKAGTAARARTGRRPAFVSSAAEGLAIVLEDGSGNVVAETNADIFDTGSANTTPTVSSCVDDTGDTGRTCTITVTAAAGSYDFVAQTYATLPASPSGPGAFGASPVLDAGNAGFQNLISGQVTTISIVLGGTVASVAVSVPPSTDALAAKTVTVGVVALDAAGDVIVSSDPYSTPIALAVTQSATGNGAASPTLAIDGGAASTSVSSTQSSDVVTLNYPAQPAANAGDVVTVSAASGGAVSSAALSPLFVTASPAAALSGSAIARTHGSVSRRPSSSAPATFDFTFTSANATGSVILTEGVTSGVPAFTVTPVAGAPAVCATALRVGALVAGIAGSATLPLESTFANTPTGGCPFIISDGYTTIPLAVTTTLSTGSGTTGANVPGKVLLFTAYASTAGTSHDAAYDPTTSRSAGTGDVLLDRLSDGSVYTIADSNLREPLGVAYDANGNIYVADGDASSEHVDEYPQSALSLFSTPAAASPSQIFSSTSLAEPNGIAVDLHTGRIYVSDYTNGTIVVFPSTATAGGPTTPYAVMQVGAHPAGIGLDAAGNLYVTYPQAPTVLEYAAPAAGTSTPVALRTIGTGGANGQYRSPVAVAVGADETVYVSDAEIAAGNVADGLCPHLEIYAPGGGVSSLTACTAFPDSMYGRTTAYAVDALKNAYVTGYDPTSGSLQIVNEAAQTQTAVAGPTFAIAGPPTPAPYAYVPYATTMEIGAGTSTAFACGNQPGAHLYVNNDTGSLVSYALPVTSASTPTALASGSQYVWLTFDPSKNLYQTLYFGAVNLLPPPYAAITSSSTDASIPNGDPYGTVVDANGHVFVAENEAGTVVELSSLTGSPIATIPNVPGSYGLALDSSGNLYVGYNGGIAVFAPPYTGAPAQTISSVANVTGIALDTNGHIFAASAKGSISVLAPPYGTANILATITNGIGTPFGISLDSSCNLYVPNYNANTTTAYAPPYTGGPFASLPGNLPDASAIGP